MNDRLDTFFTKIAAEESSLVVRAGRDDHDLGP
jgi:hypothetical protein